VIEIRLFGLVLLIVLKIWGPVFFVILWEVYCASNVPRTSSFVVMSNLQKFATPVGDSYVPGHGGTIKEVIPSYFTNSSKEPRLFESAFRILLILMNSVERKFVILSQQRLIVRNIRTSYLGRPVEIINSESSCDSRN
jgi:hypothetical protein